MTPYRIVEFDPSTAGDDEFHARWQLQVLLEQETEPEDPVTPFDKHRQSMVDKPSFQQPKHWTAFDTDGGQPIGIATLELEYTESNRYLAWMTIAVHPDARRQGIATDLLGHIVEAATVDGRTVLGGGSIEGSAGDGFCGALGFERKATERKSRLSMASVDRAMLDAWVVRAAERASDYELVGFDDRCPDELLVAFLELYHVTNTAPRDDLDMEDEVETPERFREREDKSLAKGESAWILVARHRETGEMAGFTQLFFPPYADDLSWQGWTAVHSSHRDRGLGRWLKAANCVRLMDERPAVQHVDTWNAFSNAPMLGINVEMGFELVRGYNDWQSPTDRLASAVKERASA